MLRRLLLVVAFVLAVAAPAGAQTPQVPYTPRAVIAAFDLAGTPNDTAAAQQIRNVSVEATRRILGQSAGAIVDVPGSGAGTGTVATGEIAVQRLSGFDATGAVAKRQAVGTAVQNIDGTVNGAGARVTSQWARVGVATKALGPIFRGLGVAGMVLTAGTTGWQVGTALRTMFLQADTPVAPLPVHFQSYKVESVITGAPHPACNIAGSQCAGLPNQGKVLEDTWALNGTATPNATLTDATWRNWFVDYGASPYAGCGNYPSNWNADVGPGKPWNTYISGGQTCRDPQTLAEYGNVIYDVTVTPKDLLYTKLQARGKPGQLVNAGTINNVTNGISAATLAAALRAAMQDPNDVLAPQIAHDIDPVTNGEDPTVLSVPTPRAGELYPEYRDRLEAIDLVSHKIALPSSAPDPCCGPSEVTATDPAPGTRLDPGSGVDVQVNPSNAPAPTAPGSGTGTDYTAPGNGDAPSNESSCGWTLPSQSFNLAPLTSLSLASAFPLSVLPWLQDTVSGTVVAAERPNVTFSAFGVEADLSSLANYDSAVSIFRGVLTLLLWLGVAWFLYSRTIGKG